LNSGSSHRSERREATAMNLATAGAAPARRIRCAAPLASKRRVLSPRKRRATARSRLRSLTRAALSLLPFKSHESQITSPVFWPLPETVYRVESPVTHRKQTSSTSLPETLPVPLPVPLVHPTFAAPPFSRRAHRVRSGFAAGLKRSSNPCYTVCTVRFSVETGRRTRRASPAPLRCAGEALSVRGTVAPAFYSPFAPATLVARGISA
jgi:hypothetical protein